MPKLSVTIIAKNEAANIAAALASVGWADERLVVVDESTTDGTADVARAHGARVMTRAWTGYSEQKNFAAAQAAHDWILSIDADERVTPALAEEIRRLLATGPGRPAYRLRRVSRYLERWIRTTDWYPNWQIRLYDRRRATWAPRRVHESLSMDGPPGTLTSELEHNPYRDISHHLDTMNRYTTLAAEELFDRGKRSGFGSLLVLPPAAFLRNYILRRGFLQGSAGLVVSSLNAYYVFLKYVKLWDRQRRG